MTRSQHSKTAKRGLSLLVGACVVGSGAFLTLSPATATPQAAPIVGNMPATAKGGPMNFAINLAPGTPMNTAKEVVEKAGGKVLTTYPQINTLFAQSTLDDYGTKVAEGLKAANLTLVSVGPTRQAAIKDDSGEVVVKKPDAPAPAPTQPTDPGDKPAPAPANPPADTPAPGAGADDSGATPPAADAGTASRESRQGFKVVDPPGDRSVKETWGLHAIGAIDAMKVNVMRERVVVGVIDDGIDSRHPDLAKQVDPKLSVDCSRNGIATREKRNGLDPWINENGGYHGTHVAGTIAARHGSAEGIDGVAPEATLAAVRIFRDDLANPEHVTCAFMWAGEHDFDITNNSYYVDPWEFWVPTDPSQAAGYEAVRRAVAWSQEKGVLHFASAGNSNKDTDNVTEDTESPNDIEKPIERKFKPGDNPTDIPAMLPGVVTVSAVDREDRKKPVTEQQPLKRSDFSNYGAKNIDVAAPGSAILSTFPIDNPRGQYGAISGTSMASPHAAGVGALLRSIHPELSNEELVALMEKHAKELKPRLKADPEGKAYEGKGLVNALSAVLKDQPRASISDIQLSTDGGKTWIDPSKVEAIDVVIGRPLQYKATVFGPLTKADLAIDGAAIGSTTGDGHMLQEKEITGSFVPKLKVGDNAKKINYTLFGRNFDPRADDDLKGFWAVNLRAKADPAVPVPGTNPGKGGTQPGPKDGKGMPQTGADAAPLIALATLLGAAGLGAVTVARKRRHS